MIPFTQALLTGCPIELKDTHEYRYDIEIKSIERIGYDSFMCEGEYRGWIHSYKCEILVVVIGSDYRYEVQWIS